jgi:5-methylcytosine-specific restriction protein A
MGRLRTAPPRIQSAPQRLQEGTGSWRTGKESSAARGYDYRWQKARARYLAEHPLCVMCEEDGKVTAAAVVDHVVPHRGDVRLFWDESNWQALCKKCHDGEKARQEAASGLR